MALTKFGNMSMKSLLAPFVNGLLRYYILKEQTKYMSYMSSKMAIRCNPRHKYNKMPIFSIIRNTSFTQPCLVQKMAGEIFVHVCHILKRAETCLVASQNIDF